LEEKVYMKAYNERLIQKLEKKMLDLEESEKHIKYLYGVLGAIRGVNQLIVREKNRDVLLKKTCDVLIGARGYHTVWLGLLKDEKTFATVVGSPLKQVSSFCAQVLRGYCPPCIKKALTKKDLFIFIDRSRDCGDCPLKKLHLGRNSLLIRIAHKSKLFGFLVLSLESDVYMDQEEKGLLEEVTSDIAFGLYSIELEEQHKQAEEKYRTLYESIKEGIGLSDIEGHILDANQAFLDMLGYSIEEIRRLSYYDLTPKKWYKMTTDIIKNQTMVRGYSKEYEKEYIKKDGTLLPISIRSWLTKDKQGKPVGTWAIVRDITERKQAEEKLLKKQYYLTKAQEMGIIGTWELDIQKNILIWTDENYKIFGVPLGTEMNYEIFLNCVHPDDRDYVHEKWSAGLNHEPYDIEHRLIVNDKVKWVREKADIEFDKEGKPIMAIGFTQDVTERKKSEEKLKKTMDATIETLSKTIEAKDPYTSGHQHRVCQLTVPLAQELGLAKDKIEGIRIASLIHDIGKIGLPTETLSKPSKLTDIEFSLIKGHSQIGYDILKSIDFSYPIAQIVLQHHERINGTGYPNNLKGDKILLEAKIIGIADVVEAMSSYRPYRPALGIDKALEEISKNRGTLYDPEVVDVCLKLFKGKEFKF
jgi:PAS domain S-box-containing protein